MTRAWPQPFEGGGGAGSSGAVVLSLLGATVGIAGGFAEFGSPQGCEAHKPSSAWALPGRLPPGVGPLSPAGEGVRGASTRGHLPPALFKSGFS